MKHAILLTALLVAELPAPIPDEEPPRAQQQKQAPAAAPSPGARAAARKAQEPPLQERAGELHDRMPGEPTGFPGERQPVTGPGLDPETGQPPHADIPGLRLGTRADDSQRQGPRAR